MWEIGINCYINRQYDIVIFHFQNTKWQIRFPKDEKMVRKVTFYDDFKDVKKIIKKEFGPEVSETLVNPYFAEELL